MQILALIILIIFSIVGLGAVFFTTFGTLIILLGCIIYAVLTKFSILNLKYLIILLVLYLVGEVLEYALVIIGAKRLGASNAAVIGALIGAILGATLGVAILGIGIILGTFLGIFLGAFLVELIIQRNLVNSLKAGTGGILGRLGSILAKLVIAFSMFFIVGLRLFNSSF